MKIRYDGYSSVNKAGKPWGLCSDTAKRKILGSQECRMFDGSWSEWLPVGKLSDPVDGNVYEGRNMKVADITSRDLLGMFCRKKGSNSFTVVTNAILPSSDHKKLPLESRQFDGVNAGDQLYHRDFNAPLHLWKTMNNLTWKDLQ